MSSGFIKCPHCGKDALPAIRPESRANAVKCQACGAVVERAQAVQVVKK